jgi:hypothetical protein
VNIEQRTDRRDQRTLTGKAVGPGTLAAAVQTLRDLADSLKAIAQGSTAVLHDANLEWEYDSGKSGDVGRGLVTWKLETVTRE